MENKTSYPKPLFPTKFLISRRTANVLKSGVGCCTVWHVSEGAAGFLEFGLRYWRKPHLPARVVAGPCSQQLSFSSGPYICYMLSLFHAGSSWFHSLMSVNSEIAKENSVAQKYVNLPKISKRKWTRWVCIAQLLSLLIFFFFKSLLGISFFNVPSVAVLATKNLTHGLSAPWPRCTGHSFCFSQIPSHHFPTSLLFIFGGGIQHCLYSYTQSCIIQTVMRFRKSPLLRKG